MKRHRHRYVTLLRQVSAVETVVSFNAVCYHCGRIRTAPVTSWNPTRTAP